MNQSADSLTSSLPPWLAERSRLIRDATPSTRPAYVLYWMHHLVRGHENPALDVAATLAHRRNLPVLVYQGLGGRHPFNNDRHHTFILQGARDAHREIRNRGIRAVFHLDPTGRLPTPLGRLMRRAACLVVEDFPAPPFTAWTRALAQRSPTPVVAVDGFCVVPMRAQPRRFDRAYEFRRHNQTEFDRRIPLPWPEVEASPSAFSGEVGFSPLDLERADIPSICAACSIDHSVPPVAHTSGGSVAGYARWDRFRREGLGRYARDRNDAAMEWPRGVSRLSAYLHHGQISPFRIAREARAAGGDGAAKFLDELLVWRELAHNFCFFTADPERVDVLPEWAIRSLYQHESDPRPSLLDLETLARSRSGDDLWDLTQCSLRIHGELHNNLRMTWAKSIPFWRPTAQSALEALIALNHRYALDGSDPNSYGGLLWTLGLFDRPFPDSRVLGRLRSRSTKDHARRLDLNRYRSRVMRPSTGNPVRVAVIGAGISGLTAARTLQDQGHEVQVFEKARGSGGRSATRRDAQWHFDHGAQYFTVRDPRFRQAVAAWREQGLVKPWPLRSGRVVRGEIRESSNDRERFVAVPGMSALARHLGADLNLRTGTRVTPPSRNAGRWRLRDPDGEDLGSFDRLIVSAPAPQAQALMAPIAPGLAAQAGAVQYDPTWAVMLGIASEDHPATNGLFFDDGPLSWAAENASKPGRSGHTWVLHASAEWTRMHLDATAQQVADALADYFCRVTGFPPHSIAYRSAHRWLYARVSNPLEADALWDPELGLGACGDWCREARIEGAFLSGQAVAGRLLGDLGRTAELARDRGNRPDIARP